MQRLSAMQRHHSRAEAMGAATAAAAATIVITVFMGAVSFLPLLRPQRAQVIVAIREAGSS